MPQRIFLPFIPLVYFFTLPAWGLSGNIRGQLESQLQELHELYKSMRSSKFKLLHACTETPGTTDKAAHAIQVLELSLAQALHGRDLKMELIRQGERWLLGQAWAPDWNRQLYTVDATQLKIAGTAPQHELSGRLQIQILLDPVQRAMEGAEGKTGSELNCVFVLEGTLVQNKLKGSFATQAEGGPLPIPASKGAIEGTLRSISASDTPAAIPALELKQFDEFELYGEAVVLERHLTALHRELRALALARRSNAEIRIALEQTTFFAPVRKQLKSTGEQQKKKKEEAPGLPDLGGDLDALGLGSSGASRGKKKADSGTSAGDAGVKEVVEGTAQIVRYAQMLLADLKRYERQEPPAFLVDRVPCDDPDFTTVYHSLALPHAETQPNALPQQLGGPGEVRWASIKHWHLIGPFPMEPTTPHLYDFQPLPFAKEAAYRCLEERLGKAYKGPAELKWQAEIGQGPQFAISAPNWSSSNRYWLAGLDERSKDKGGLEDSTFYAATQVTAPEEVELYASIGLHRQGQLYLNGVLIWMGPTKLYPLAKEEHFLTRLKLRKGQNELLFRIDNDRKTPGFWIALCIQGEPRSKAVVEAHEAQLAAARKARKPQDWQGWRGNMLGHFPQERPPLAWHIKTGENILWKTPLPIWGNGTPVVAGNKVFFTMEPHTLLCMDKLTGEVLWQRHCNLYQLLGEELAKEGQRLYEAALAGYQQRQKIQPDRAVTRTGHYWGHGSADVQEEEPKEPPPITEAQAAKSSQEDKSDLKKAENEFLAFMRKHSEVTGLDGYWYDHHGYAMATPVTDGTHLWWKNGMGVAVCLDLDGNVKWMVRTHGETGGAANISSPILVEDKLILLLPAIDEKLKRNKRGGMQLVALNKSTGETLWRSEAFQNGGWGAATPVPIWLTNGREHQYVIAASGGTIVRAEDGKTLIPYTGGVIPDSTPVWHDDVLYTSSGRGQTAFKLVMKDRDTLGFRRLWSAGPSYEFGSCLMLDDMIYCEESRRSDPGEHWRDYTLVDRFTGRSIRTIPRINRKMGVAWAPSAFAGEHVFLVDCHSMFTHGEPRPPSTMTVLTRGTNPLVLDCSPLDRCLSAPTFDGERIYLRGYKWAYCIGYTGEAGKRYEASRIAENLMDECYPEYPQDVKPIEIAPGSRSLSRHALELKQEPPVLAPLQWQFCGPFSLTAAVRNKAPALEGFPPVDSKLKLGDTEKTWVMLEKKNFDLTGQDHSTLGPTFDLFEKTRRWTDVMAPVKAQPQTVGYYACAVRLNAPGIYRFEQNISQSRSWLNGTELQHGQRLSLKAGEYLLLVEIRLEEKLPASLYLSPRFFPSQEVTQEQAAWKQYVSRIEPYLNRVIEFAPDTREAARARAILKR